MVQRWLNHFVRQYWKTFLSLVCEGVQSSAGTQTLTALFPALIEVAQRGAEPGPSRRVLPGASETMGLDICLFLRWSAPTGEWSESVWPHSQAGCAVPQGLWAGECTITHNWGASLLSRAFLNNFDAVVFSGWEMGRQETKQDFLFVYFFSFISSFYHRFSMGV